MVLRLAFLIAGCVAAALANPEAPGRDVVNVKCEAWSSSAAWGNSAAWGSPAAVVQEN
jgi:hypothetical protein